MILRSHAAQDAEVSNERAKFACIFENVAINGNSLSLLECMQSCRCAAEVTHVAKNVAHTMDSVLIPRALHMLMQTSPPSLCRGVYPELFST